LNRILPSAIRILSAEPVAEDFHARHSAIGKVYQYRIFRGGICPPFLARYVSVIRWPLDLDAMQSAADKILGEHDFTSFAASDPDRAERLAHDSRSQGDIHTTVETYTNATCGNVRHIEISQWSRESVLPSADTLATMLVGAQTAVSVDTTASQVGEILTYTVRGNGFLHHMVRNLVGTFVEVGRGSMSASELPRILACRDRAAAGPTAAASGLCLMKVLY
jgi:tRNA pseudouridine38-40 synthase